MEQIICELSFQTSGEGFTDITPSINNWIIKKQISKGILIVYLHHTSCSLTINENADPNVLKDLSCYMKALVPEEGFRAISGQGERNSYLHSDEGMDDMPAHIRTALTCSCLSFSIQASKLVLGTWQAVYLWEHRMKNHTRRVSLHAIGEKQEKNDAFITSQHR